MTHIDNTPRIYIADVAAYNAGIVHGVWIDATESVADIHHQIQQMLATSPVAGSEEWALHDYESFGGYPVSVYEGLERVHDVALFIDEHQAFGAAVLDYASDLEAANTLIEDHYHGCYTSVTDYAQQLTEDTTSIPEHLAYYIDYERMGRDMEIGGDIFTIETAHDEVHVFSHG